MKYRVTGFELLNDQGERRKTVVEECILGEREFFFRFFFSIGW